MTEHSRILVVDDDVQVCEMTKLVLRTGQFRDIVCVPSADEAFELLDIERDDPELPPRFDLVLLDIYMPGIDGIETCARIRNTRRYRDIPILIVSGATETQALNQVFMAGAHDFLTKPVKPLEFLARVRAALRFKRELDRRRTIEAKLMHINRSLQTDQEEEAPREISGAAGPRAFRFRLQEAAEAGSPCGMIGICFRSPELADSEIAMRLALLDAPINWTMSAYDKGTFMVLAPGAGSDVLNAFAEKIRTLAEQTSAMHEAETGRTCELALEIATAQSRGLELLALPSELKTILDRNFALRDEAA